MGAFLADVTQSYSPAAVVAGQGGGAGDLPHFLAGSFNLGAGCGQELAKNKSGELAMHRAARANALHDLLPDVTALLEMQGALLAGFLRQLALANILAVTRLAAGDAVQFQGFYSGRLSAGGD